MDEVIGGTWHNAQSVDLHVRGRIRRAAACQVGCCRRSVRQTELSSETTRVARSQSPQPCSPVHCVCLRACTGGSPAAGPHAVHGGVRTPACVLHTAAVTCIVARCCSRYGASSSGRSWEPVDASAPGGYCTAERAAACMLHTAAATLIAVRCCR